MENTVTSNGLMALIGVVAGGAVTKIIERLFISRERGRSSDVDKTRFLSQEEAQFRNDLRSQIQDLRNVQKEMREQVTELQESVDEWRAKYYAQLTENISLQKLPLQYETLKAEYERLKEEYELLLKEHENLKKRFNDLEKRLEIR